MNPREQRQRHTAVAQLEADTIVVMDALYSKLRDEIEAASEKQRGLVSEERDYRLRLAAEQRSYVDSVQQAVELQLDRLDRVLRERMDGVLKRGFLGRLKWLLVGR